MPWRGPAWPDIRRRVSVDTTGAARPRIRQRASTHDAQSHVVGAWRDSGSVADRLPLANLITLGARDFGALRDFYRRVGWPQVMDDGEFAVFELRGIVLALFPLTKLARDGNTEPEPGSGGIRFTIGVQVDSAEQVDRLTEHMRAAGARVTKEPVDAEFFTGRSAYLCDPEGNYFEIVWADMPNNPVVIAARRAAGL
jgi:predicted lactoylglutathione lyase